MSTLTKHLKKLRQEFTKKHASFGSRWKNVFSNEKQINVDGPGGLPDGPDVAITGITKANNKCTSEH